MVENSDTLRVLLSVKHQVLVEQCARCFFACGAFKGMFTAKFRDVQQRVLAEMSLIDPQEVVLRDT